MAIAYAAKNPLHILIMRNFYDYLFHGIRENLTSLYEDPENVEKIFAQHQAILDAISSRDPDRAYASMNIHISFVKEFFKNKKM
jgi:DNA-binding FadR family transcriptional regulator